MFGSFEELRDMSHLLALNAGDHGISQGFERFFLELGAKNARPLLKKLRIRLEIHAAAFGDVSPDRRLDRRGELLRCERPRQCELVSRTRHLPREDPRDLTFGHLAESLVLLAHQERRGRTWIEPRWGPHAGAMIVVHLA